MNYHVTAQYPRGEEKLIAEFGSSTDATIFLTKKISIDQQQAKKQVYRLYEDSELLTAFNENHLSVPYAQYADGNSDFINQTPFLFKVTIQTINSSTRKNIANFNDSNDASLFIGGKCETDSTVNDNDLFGLFKEDILIKTLNKIILAYQKAKSVGSTTNQSMATFNPSPTPTRPTPPGGPSDCWIEKEDESS